MPHQTNQVRHIHLTLCSAYHRIKVSSLSTRQLCFLVLLIRKFLYIFAGKDEK